MEKRKRAKPRGAEWTVGTPREFLRGRTRAGVEPHLGEGTDSQRLGTVRMRDAARNNRAQASRSETNA
jgi:hypothetical protein